MANLMEASHQWATRPPDERFWTVDDLLESASASADHSWEQTVTGLGFVGSDDNDLKVRVGPKQLNFTNYSFNQTCSLLQAPAQYLQRLPAKLAAENLKCSLEQREEAGRGLTALCHTNGKDTLRAVTSTQYPRIWDWEIAERVRSMVQLRHWRLPPGRPTGQDGEVTRRATEADCLRDRSSALSINPGDLIAPSGAYRSDRDMFIFLVNEEVAISNQMCRGVFVKSTETGNGAIWICTFLYNKVCGNHIVWGAKDVTKTRIIHKGESDVVRRRFATAVHREEHRSALEDESALKSADRVMLGGNKEEVVDFLYAKRFGSRKLLNRSYDLAVMYPEDGHKSPNSAFGMANGLSRHSQEIVYVDAKTQVDEAAGKLLTLATQ